MPKQDFNIDDFKKSWQEQSVPEVYETSEIEAMLNKSSRNYVKYILDKYCRIFIFCCSKYIFNFLLRPK